jgi:hypothetical protein
MIGTTRLGRRTIRIIMMATSIGAQPLWAFSHGEELRDVSLSLGGSGRVS